MEEGANKKALKAHELHRWSAGRGHGTEDTEAAGEHACREPGDGPGKAGTGRGAASCGALSKARPPHLSQHTTERDMTRAGLQTLSCSG